MNNPIEILKSIEEFRKDYPNSNRVAFLIMRFKEDEQYQNIVKCAKDAFQRYGITLLRADDKVYHDDLFLNILTYIHGCSIGVAIFDRIITNEFNPNVSLEIGYMMALAKPICLLKDDTLDTLPTDLFGKLYKSFNTYKPEISIDKHVGQWLRDKKLDFTCYQCSVSVDYNLSLQGYDQKFLDELISGIKLMSPNVEVKFLRVRQSDDSQHTVIDFEANRGFYEHLKYLHNNDRLSVVCGCKVLDIAPIGEEVPIVAFISSSGHEAFYSCHLQRIEGFEKCAQDAIKYLSNKTTKVNECEIYITYSNDFYYYHSNLVKQGFIYTTKVQTQDSNLLNALKMITGYYGTNIDSKPTEEELVIAHHFKVKYILDKRAITRNNLHIDYCGTNRIFAVNP